MIEATGIFIDQLDRIFHELIAKGWRAAQAEDYAIEQAYEAAREWLRGQAIARQPDA